MTKARGWRLALIVAGLVILVDQATKAWIVHTRSLGERTNIFLALDLNYVRNDGVAFGALGGGGTLLVVIVCVALGGLLVFFAFRADQPMLWLPVGAVAGGALGNLADRARDGAVVDFLDPIAWPAFNVADICVVVGVLGLVYLMEGPRDSKDSRQQTAHSEEPK